jgi:hypothetical protein
LKGTLGAVLDDGLDGASTTGRIFYLSRVVNTSPYVVQPNSSGYVRVVINPYAVLPPALGSCVGFVIRPYSSSNPPDVFRADGVTVTAGCP